MASAEGVCSDVGAQSAAAARPAPREAGRRRAPRDLRAERHPVRQVAYLAEAPVRVVSLRTPCSPPLPPPPLLTQPTWRRARPAGPSAAGVTVL